MGHVTWTMQVLCLCWLIVAVDYVGAAIQNDMSLIT
ncbi:hypothetical protein SLEP1_g28135 [Rubroshorea leprosula]|uniref:Uncharacterized protein n=1 Tax=Rubroshorea leprosula TaxID=152421 RepID=A0AAV5JSP1_9ROSI|nr:hypothetical protein SLEP1_g28135 [Rubroshorea leprosula]